jgi:hypothetical protein
VRLYVYGSITVRHDSPIRLREPKGRNPEDQFFSDIHVRDSDAGAVITLTARADSKPLAQRAALHFVGQALDVLALDTRQPIYLSQYSRQPIRPETRDVTRIIERDELHRAFATARDLEDEWRPFLRALSWYRKGLYTEEPFDKFLAFWNSIEGVTSKYYPSGSCTGRGSKCHMWECFKEIWGECEDWPIISGNRSWIDDNYDTRKNIAHGIMPVDIRRTESVIDMLDTIEAVAHTFLTNWRTMKVPPPNLDAYN